LQDNSSSRKDRKERAVGDLIDSLRKRENVRQGLRSKRKKGGSWDRVRKKRFEKKERGLKLS